MQEIKEEYEGRLQAQHAKTCQLENVLTTQPQAPNMKNPPLSPPRPHNTSSNNVAKYVNVQEKEKLPNQHFDNNKTDCASTPVVSHKKQLSQSSRSSRSSGDLEAEVTEEMAMKNTEIMALRGQLKTLQSTLQDKDRAIAALRDQNSTKSEELQLAREQIDCLLSQSDKTLSLTNQTTQTSKEDRNDGDGEEEGEEADGASQPLLSPVSEREYVLSLERQVDELRGKVQEAEGVVETERLQWLEEKNKVLFVLDNRKLNPFHASCFRETYCYLPGVRG